MSPNLRQAAHRALDIILDALAEEQAVAAGRPPKRRTRGPAKPPPLVVPALAPERLAELEAQADRHLGRAGYKKAG